jgi:hypothetical protein
VIAYSSTNIKKDGKLRKIRIGTLDKKLETRHAPGYYLEP